MRLTSLSKILIFLVGLGLVATAVLKFVPSARQFFQRLASQEATPREGTPTPASPSAASALPSGVKPVLRLQGSNTVGRDLAPALAEKLLAREGATEIRRVTVADDEFLVQGRISGQVDPVAIAISAHGSGTAFQGLADGSADLGMSSRRIKPDEKLALAALGDMTSSSAEHVLALDGIAIIVSRDNPVDSLSLDQVRDLFSGRLTDWSAVGGTGGDLTILARDDRSGTFDTFKDLVLRGAPLAQGAQRYEDSRQLAAEVAANPKSIGFVGLAYVGDAKAIKISEGGSIAYRPTVFTVRTEDYRLSRRLYLYSSAKSTNRWVSQFVQFALSDEGQAVVDAVGFVGQSLEGAVGAEAPIPQGDVPPEYARLTRDASRLPLDFRFESGSDRLDNKALRDIGRLLESLSRRENRGQRILLFGFADGLGNPETNRRLSASRAAAVAAELRSEGVEAEVATGFGSALPVASNESEDGRHRNRRVEVWIR